MIAFSFTFPACRYHSNPWNRHVNEGDVSWPPEPVRILRALIATWWRKSDPLQFPEPILDSLIDKLAESPPNFHLPNGVHSHIRTYMPVPPKKKLIYDAFVRFADESRMIVVWPELALTDEQETLADHLLRNICYLGRAESLVEGQLINDWEKENVNATPQTSMVQQDNMELEPVDVLLPQSPNDWNVLREKLLKKLQHEKGAKRKLMESTLPSKLSQALAVDTGNWLRAGWTSPPPTKKIVYMRRPLNRTKQKVTPVKFDPYIQPNQPEVARFVLAGRPRPRVEDSLSIGEIARRALMSGQGNPPVEFSGRSDTGYLKSVTPHSHAFFLAEDADHDKFIDHLVVFCRNGFSDEARYRLDRLTKLWISEPRGDDEDKGRQEWRLALEDIAKPECFSEVSSLLGRSKTWKSVTPYLKPWHSKRNFGILEQVTREIELRKYLPSPTEVTILPEESKLYKEIRAVNFRRFRNRKGLQQPDKLGSFLKLEFPEEIDGPLAIGFACHYGLGLFHSEE